MRKEKDLLNELNGIFGFVIYDKVEKEFLVARDHIGIIPLYVWVGMMWGHYLFHLN